MGIVNTDNPGKRRNALMRSSAEIIRHLMLANAISDETKDQLAQLVYCLRDIDEGIDESAKAWEKRDYWMKAEEFRNNWQWASSSADELARLIYEEKWMFLPPLLVRLSTKFSDINITKFTRDASLWNGAYRRLMAEPR